MKQRNLVLTLVSLSMVMLGLNAASNKNVAEVHEHTKGYPEYIAIIPKKTGVNRNSSEERIIDKNNLPQKIRY